MTKEMHKALKYKLDTLVNRSQLDQAYHMLQKAGYTEHHAGLLIHVAIKATLAGPASTVTRMNNDEHFCASCR